MKKLVSLISVVVLLLTAFGVVALTSAADTAVAGGNGFHYNENGDPIMDFVDPADGAQVGTWWWTTNDAFDTEKRDMYLNFLEENGVNEIYFYGFYMLQSKGDRSQLHEFVSEANAHGLAISFIYDDPEIATENGNHYLRSAASDYLAYVGEYPDDVLDGLHFDVEHKTTNQFVNNMVAQFAEARERGVPLAMDVNCAMDATAGELNGVKGIYNIIAANVDTLSLMSYKDSYERIWSLGKNALAAAREQGCRVVFGVETGDYSTGVAPHFETFNDPGDEFAQEDKEFMYGQLAQVYAELKKNPPAGGFGVAVHQHEDWYNLKKSATPVTTRNNPVKPSEKKGEIEGKVLWSGNVDQKISIGNPTPYIGKLTGDVNDAINAAVQADIRENGHIAEDEYYEITVNGYARGESGYATTGFVVGDYQIWSQSHFDDCSVLKKLEGDYTQRLYGDATDKMEREILPEKMDETTEFVFFSDSNGDWTDICQVNSLSITVYRHGEYTGVDEPETTATDVEPTETEVETTATATEPARTKPAPKPTKKTGKKTTTQPAPLLLGDANNDSVVNLKDVLTLRKFLAGMDVEIRMDNANANQDTAVNMKDVLLLRKFIAGIVKTIG